MTHSCPNCGESRYWDGTNCLPCGRAAQPTVSQSDQTVTVKIPAGSKATCGGDRWRAEFGDYAGLGIVEIPDDCPKGCEGCSVCGRRCDDCEEWGGECTCHQADLYDGVR